MTTPDSKPGERSVAPDPTQFDPETRARQKAARRTLKQYLTVAFRPKVLLTGPVIYSLIIPFAIIDLWVTLYQRLTFPVYGIPLVRRRNYVVIDRQHLEYLTGWEKLNCVYCGYSNGVANYVREVSARTEQYWCPIKHAAKIEGTHPAYEVFLEYGDHQNFRRRWWDVRRHVKDLPPRKEADPRLHALDAAKEKKGATE